MRLLTLGTVVVATDLDMASQAAIDSAHRLAASAGASLHVVHVVPDVAVGGDSAAAVRERIRTSLGSLDIPLGDAEVHVLPGPAAATIRSFADRMGADVIVVGPHRERDGHAGELGGTARAVVEGAYVPCLIVPRALRLPLGRVLVPIDFSDTARGALLVGLSWASALRSPRNEGHTTRLTALHVEPLDSTAGGAASALEQELDVLRGGPEGWAGVEIAGRIERGDDAAQVIQRYTAEHEADLLVIGTRGQGADEVSRLGSVSAAVTARASLPTLLIPPAVWRVHARTQHAPVG